MHSKVIMTAFFGTISRSVTDWRVRSEGGLEIIEA